MIARAASSISQSGASSGLFGIYDPGSGENLPAPERISNCVLFDEIDLSLEERFQFLDHIHPIPGAQHSGRVDFDQDIDIALGMKIIP